MRDPYSILGVSRDASKMAIKVAFRNLAKKWHPDNDQENPLFHKKFQEINEAYNTLINDKKRKQFDASDIRNIFKRMRNDKSGYYADYKSNSTSSNNSHNENNNYKTSSLNTAGTENLYNTSGLNDAPINATEKFANILKNSNARGQFSDILKNSKTDEPLKSSRAKNNKVEKSLGRNINYTVSVSPNDAIDGTKKRIRLFNGQWIDVIIPPHTKNGQVLRIKGKGLQGEGSGRRGDVMIKIEVEAPDIFRLEEDKVFIDIPITLSEAIKGTVIPIPTLAGSVLLNIPVGVNNGHTMRIKNKGITMDNKKKGDLFAVIRIIMPPNADKELKLFIEKWSKNNPYEVRSHFNKLL